MKMEWIVLRRDWEGERERDSDRVKDSQNEKVIIKQERGDKARKQLYFIKGNRKRKERKIDRQKEREKEKEIDFVGGCVPEVLQKNDKLSQALI